MGRALVSVKSGSVNSSQIRDLKGVLEREKAEIGLFVTLEEPSSPMQLEATTAGVYTSALSGRDYPRIQILTIRELLEGHTRPTFQCWCSRPTSRPSGSPRRPPNRANSSASRSPRQVVDRLPANCRNFDGLCRALPSRVVSTSDVAARDLQSARRICPTWRTGLTSQGAGSPGEG